MTIHVCTSPDDLPGERVGSLTTEDWSTVAWCARPDDRRGASLVYDGLVATGVDWRANPAVRLDIDTDLRHLRARLHVAHTRTLVLGNAHWTTPTARKTIIDLAQQTGGDLYLCYTDGEGTTSKNSGILDDAHRHGWAVHPSEEFPLGRPICSDPQQKATDESPARSVPGLPTVGFPMFRHWCRQLLRADDFRTVDRWYLDAYRAASAVAPEDRQAAGELAAAQLAAGSRSETITRLRAIQAAWFRAGVVWNLPISTLDAWRSHEFTPKPTRADYARLSALHNPRTAAVAVLASVGVDTEDMPAITAADIAGADGTATAGLPREALRPLAIHHAHTGGALLRQERPRTLAQEIKYLTTQFDFPLQVRRGPRTTSRHPLHPDALDLRPYTKAA